MGSGLTKNAKPAVVNGDVTSRDSGLSSESTSGTFPRQSTAKAATGKHATELNLASEQGQAEIFISYQWDKQRQVKALYDKLTGLGYSCWMDLEQMGGGDNLNDKIEEGISGCRVFLSCVTEKYAASENCRREVSVADGRKKPIIPLKLDQSAWPPTGPMAMVFGPKLFINFCKPNEEVQKHWNCPQFQELVDRIDRSMNPLQANTSTNAETTTLNSAEQDTWRTQKLTFAVRLNLGENAVVTGVAFIDNKICAVCEDGDAPVKIFSCSPPYNELGEVPLEKVKDRVQVPQDLIASKDTGLLYLTTTVFGRYEKRAYYGPWRDPYHGYVWSMRPIISGPKRDVKKIIEIENGIVGISMTSGRLLVALSEPERELHVHDVGNGRLLKKIPLTLTPNYGIETTRGTYLVCVQSNETPMLEVDDSGRPVQMYEVDQEETTEAEDEDGDDGQIARVLVDDVNGCLLAIEQNDKRLIMLNSKLQFDCVLLTHLQKLVSPTRMCYDRDSSSLALAGDNVVNLYTFKEASQENATISRMAKTKPLGCYKQKPMFVHCIDLPIHGTKVMGVAHLDNKFCVVSNIDDSGVTMFADTPPYSEVGIISLEKVEFQVQTPQDLVACEGKGLLYAATNVFRTTDDSGKNLLRTAKQLYEGEFEKFEDDYTNASNNPFYGYVWSVSPKERKVTKVVSVDHGINGVSLTSNRLLIATLGHVNRLLVYSVDDGRLLTQIDLDLSPYYAVETGRGTYYVCSNDFDTQVSEVGADGCVIDSYETEGHKRELQESIRSQAQGEIYRIFLDSANNCLLAAEFDEQRVVLLDSNLHKERIVLTEQQKIEGPRRLCLACDKKMLAVAGFGSVKLFSLK